MYHKWQSYNVWFPEISSVTDIISCHFGLLFVLLPPNNPENQNFEKMKKTFGNITILNMSTINENPGNIIILHKCTKTHDHMLYCSWDMMHDRCNCYLFILSNFFPVYPPHSPKNENMKKLKKTDIIISSRYHHLIQVYINHDHVICCSWDLMCDRCNCYFSFRAIFCPFTPLKTRKMRIKKKMKKCLISSFYAIVPKIMIIGYTVPEIWCVIDVTFTFHVGPFFNLLPP